jgi:hypothetical protein
MSRLPGVTLVAATLFAAACHSGSAELPGGSEIEGVLAGVLPEGWSLIESKDGQAPPGHGPVEQYGRLYVLLGPGPVAFQWKDESGEWHEEALARETVELWVMPGFYRPSLRRFLEHHRHIPPERIYRSDSLRVYGRVSHRIIAEEQFSELLQSARSTSWSDIGRKDCTWQDWPRDLAAGLKTNYD